MASLGCHGRGSSPSAWTDRLSRRDGWISCEVCPGPLTTELIAGGMDRNCVVFKIDGWDRCDEKAIDGSKAALSDSVTNDPTDDRVLIRINQSWRTTWL